MLTRQVICSTDVRRNILQNASARCIKYTHWHGCFSIGLAEALDTGLPIRWRSPRVFPCTWASVDGFGNRPCAACSWSFPLISFLPPSRSAWSLVTSRVHNTCVLCRLPASASQQRGPRLQCVHGERDPSAAHPEDLCLGIISSPVKFCTRQPQVSQARSGRSLCQRDTCPQI